MAGLVGWLVVSEITNTALSRPQTHRLSAVQPNVTAIQKGEDPSIHVDIQVRAPYDDTCPASLPGFPSPFAK